MIKRHGRGGGRLLALEQRDHYVTHEGGRRVVLNAERYVLWDIVQRFCGWRQTRRGHA